MKNQQMPLFQFYSYIKGSLHVSGLQAHLQDSSHSYSKLNTRIKIHKPNNPIRPVVNSINAPTYKIAKKLNDILKQCLQLKNQYNTPSSEILARDITTLKINEHRMITYDIKDLYVNIPIEETLTIARQQLIENNDGNMTDHNMPTHHTKSKLLRIPK